jgi:hypothetical protein
MLLLKRSVLYFDGQRQAQRGRERGLAVVGRRFGVMRIIKIPPSGHQLLSSSDPKNSYQPTHKILMTRVRQFLDFYLTKIFFCQRLSTIRLRIPVPDFVCHIDFEFNREQAES